MSYTGTYQTHNITSCLSDTRQKSKKAIGFHRQAWHFELNLLLYEKNFLLDGQTRQKQERRACEESQAENQGRSPGLSQQQDHSSRGS